MSFYHVSVGSSSRRGIFTAAHSFVVSSEANQSRIQNYYLQQYRGFEVGVEVIAEAPLKPVIPDDPASFPPI